MGIYFDLYKVPSTQFQSGPVDIVDTFENVSKMFTLIIAITCQW